MHGTQSSTRRSGEKITYYVCPTHMHKPQDKARFPGHLRASIREDVLTAKLGEFLDDYAFGYDRAARLAQLIPASQAQQDDIDHDRTAALTRKLKKADTAMNGLAAEIGKLAGKTDPVSNAIRDRLTTQFTQRYDEKTSIEAKLQAIEQAAPLPDSDLTLIDELPYAPGLLAHAPTTSANASPPPSACKPSTGKTPGKPPSSSPPPPPSTPSWPTPASTTTPPPRTPKPPTPPPAQTRP